MGLRIRSSTGCWTCRLRRKKCDESKPSCNNCSRLMLPCDGYAERPHWLDGGAQEKLRAERTKRTVRTNAITKRSNTHIRRQSLVQRVQPEITLESTINVIHSPEIMTLPTPDEIAIGSLELDMDELWQMPPLSWPGEDLIGSIDSQPDILQSQYDTTQSHASSSSGKCCIRPDCNEQQRSVEEADLILYYFDVVYNSQLPFANKSEKRGWLHVIIHRTRLSYLATLSISTFHRRQDNNEGTQNLAVATGYYDSAVLELQTRVEKVDLDHISGLDSAIDCCFALNLLMFLELLRGDTTSFKTHLKAACNLLVRLEHSKYIAAMREGVNCFGHSCENDSVNIAALQFVIPSLRWYDTMHSCSLRTMGYLGAVTGTCLMTPGTPPENYAERLAGCPFWVMTSLSQIADLDSWKRNATEKGSLSVIELVARAGTIQKTVESQRDSWKEGQETATDSSEGMISHITEIFFSAAVLYLHVVVAGSHREVPEIALKVRETIQLFRSLPDYKMLSYVVWPFCITGCLAMEDQRAFLVEMAQRMVSAFANSGVERALCLMTECWRLRDHGVAENPDWTFAMRSLECEVVCL